MPTEPRKPLIVISYAHADEPEKPAEDEVKWLSIRDRLSQGGDQARRGRPLDRTGSCLEAVPEPCSAR
jgi:hypothetical protein